MAKALLSTKVPIIVALALTLGMLASFSIQGYRLWQQRNAVVEPTSEAINAPPPQRATANAQDVANANLFGLPPVESQGQPAVRTENLPTTNLRLTLRGVSASENEGSNSALIEGPDQQTQVYVIGDQLPGEAVLRAVYANRVVIERRGRLENLYFPTAEESSSSSGVSNYEEYPVDQYQENGYQEAPQEQMYQDDSQSTTPEDIPAEQSGQDEFQPDESAVPEEEFPSGQGAEDPVPTASDPAYVLDALSEQRKQEIRERLRRLREQINN